MRSLLSGLFCLLACISPAATAEVSPFQGVCSSKDQLLNRPPTGLFVRDYPVLDQQGLTAQTFLRSVLRAALAKLDQDLVFSGNILKCHGEEHKDQAICDELKQYVSEHLPALVKDARFHLSLAQSPQDVMSIFSQTSTIANSHMSVSGTVKLRPWAPLTQGESARANGILRDYRREIVAHYASTWGRYDGTPEQRKAVMASMLGTRQGHFFEYRTYMLAMPFLQYFTKADPSVSDILGYIAEFQTNALKEKAYLVDLLAKLAGHIDNAQMDEIVGVGMQYSAYVEILLKQNPTYCGLATSLLYTQMNRGLGNEIKIGVPLLAASFVSLLAPPIAAYTLGIVASGYFTYTAYERYDHVSRRLGTAIMSETSDPVDIEAWQTRDQMLSEAILFPLSFAGGRFAVKGVRVFLNNRVSIQPELRGSVYIPRVLAQTFQKFSRRSL